MKDAFVHLSIIVLKIYLGEGGGLAAFSPRSGSHPGEPVTMVEVDRHPVAGATPDCTFEIDHGPVIDQLAGSVFHE